MSVVVWSYGSDLRGYNIHTERKPVRGTSTISSWLCGTGLVSIDARVLQLTEVSTVWARRIQMYFRTYCSCCSITYVSKWPCFSSNVYLPAER